MLGLILKDLLNLKKQGKLMLLMIVLYAVLAVINDMYGIFAVFVVIGAMMPMTALAYDERAHWDKLVLTMPVSRTAIVLSKYLLGLGLAAVGLTVFIGVSLPTAPDRWQENLLTASAVFALALLMIAIMMPLLLKFGSEKFRMMMILIFLLPFLLVLCLIRFVPMPEFSQSQIELLVIAAVAVMLLLFLLSMWISVQIVRRKEY